MSSPVPELAHRLAEVLRAFRDAGVEPTSEEIVWLADLRRACDKPCDGSIPWLCGAPVEWCGVKWYAMHRLAEGWFLRAMALTGDDNHTQTAIYLYAHAFSAPGDRSLINISTIADIEREVMPWYDALPMPDDADQITALCERLTEIDGGVASVPDPDRSETETESEDNSTRFVALACKAFPGVSPDYWLTDMPSHAIREMISSMSATEGDGWATSERRTSAIANWLKAVKWVWRNHSE